MSQQNPTNTILSYGGGVQSVAILVLVAQGKLPTPDLAIMADTGRERSSTWRYLEQYAKPLMMELGISFEIASRELSTVDLYAHNGDLLIPAFTSTGKMPTFCSSEWKKLTVRRRLRQLGYGPKNPIMIWLGMSLDEIHRMRHSDREWIVNHWPLVYDYKLRRHECELEITRFGLPVPSKSACWMCPNMDDAEWKEVQLHDPADFDRAVKLDEAIRLTDGGVFVHRSRKPLADVDFDQELAENDMSECTEFCWT